MVSNPLLSSYPLICPSDSPKLERFLRPYLLPFIPAAGLLPMVTLTRARHQFGLHVLTISVIMPFAGDPPQQTHDARPTPNDAMSPNGCVIEGSP